MEKEVVEPSIRELFDLSGKVAVVTGGARGIGKAITKRLAEAGAAVVMASRDKEVGDEVARELTAMDYNVAWMRCDVSDDSEVTSLMANTVKTFGGLDILVNNAAVFPLKPVTEMDVATYAQVYDVNVKGTLLCCISGCQQMIRQGRGGVIVNIASMSANLPTIGFTAYDSSKAAVVMLTKTLALELARYNIRVNSVSPGFTASSPHLEKQESWRCPRVVLGHRAASSDEEARVVLFLASPASNFITGTDILCDGGTSLPTIYDSQHLKALGS